RLRPRELDLRSANLGDVEVEIAHQETAELRFSERLEELGVIAARDVEFPHTGIVTQPLALDGTADARTQIGPNGVPALAPAISLPLTDPPVEIARPLAQRRADEFVGGLLAEPFAQCPDHGQEHACLKFHLVKEGERCSVWVFHSALIHCEGLLGGWT